MNKRTLNSFITLNFPPLLLPSLKRKFRAANELLCLQMLVHWHAVKQNKLFYILCWRFIRLFGDGVPPTKIQLAYA